MTAPSSTGGPGSLRARLAPLQAAWAQRQPRERHLVRLAAWVLGRSRGKCCGSC